MLKTNFALIADTSRKLVIKMEYKYVIKVDMCKGIGALRLIGKSGAKPARSRHCNGDDALYMPLG